MVGGCVLRPETERLKFLANDEQLKKVNDEMNKIAKEQAALEHEKLK
jgi:hypothetical protein